MELKQLKGVMFNDEAMRESIDALCTEDLAPDEHDAANNLLNRAYELGHLSTGLGGHLFVAVDNSDGVEMLLGYIAALEFEEYNDHPGSYAPLLAETLERGYLDSLYCMVDIAVDVRIDDKELMPDLLEKSAEQAYDDGAQYYALQSDDTDFIEAAVDMLGDPIFVQRREEDDDGPVSSVLVFDMDKAPFTDY